MKKAFLRNGAVTQICSEKFCAMEPFLIKLEGKFATLLERFPTSVFPYVICEDLRLLQTF